MRVETTGTLTAAGALELSPNPMALTALTTMKLPKRVRAHEAGRRAPFFLSAISSAPCREDEITLAQDHAGVIFLT